MVNGQQADGADAPGFGEALAVWARIGLLSFGGPAGQIALMHRVLVEEKRWVSEQRFLGALNFCMLLPGPEAQQLATYIGWLLHGARGGLVAGTLFVLPGFAVILALSFLYVTFHAAPWLETLFFGLKAAVLAIVIEAVIRIGRRALKTPTHVALAGLAFVALFAFHVPFPVVVLVAGIIGWVGARMWPKMFVATPKAVMQADSALDRALATRALAADRSFARAMRVLALGCVLWAAPVVVLGWMFGWHGIFPTIAAFFSKMAVVTFGGAYAVLAYVAQQAVEAFHWLKPGEMLDGLAMAETTPGPLILVLVYVGFLAAYRDPGVLSPLAAGVVGATLTTWVTFVPCFLWIFLGAPYIERLQANAALSGALSAITAAVVGVILNLSVWFGLHALFGSLRRVTLGPLDVEWPVLASFTPAAGVIAAVALVMVFRLKLGMAATLAVCGALGFVLRGLNLA